MIKISETETVFLELYKAGVWGRKAPDARPFAEPVDWQGVIDIAKAQAVFGNVVEGMVCFDDLQIERKMKLKLIGRLMQVEKLNNRLNEAIPFLYEKLASISVTPILLKGQGVALNYIKPTSRQSGDIDLYIPSRQQFDAACALFRRHLRQMEETNPDSLETVFKINEVVVELHGRILSSINRRLERRFPAWSVDMFNNNKPRQVNIGKGTAIVPAVPFDIVFVFIHLARHYFAGGIGLRQVADWMRLLYTHYDEIDTHKLCDDLAYLGLQRSWRVFGTMAVDHLGYPKERMPLYDAKYSSKGRRVLRYILDSGNFGLHDKRTVSNSSNYYIRRAKAFAGNTIKIFRNFGMFPQESLYCFPDYLRNGLKRTNW